MVVGTVAGRIFISTYSEGSALGVPLKQLAQDSMLVSICSVKFVISNKEYLINILKIFTATSKRGLHKIRNNTLIACLNRIIISCFVMYGEIILKAMVNIIIIIWILVRCLNGSP